MAACPDADSVVTECEEETEVREDMKRFVRLVMKKELNKQLKEKWLSDKEEVRSWVHSEGNKNADAALEDLEAFMKEVVNDETTVEGTIGSIFFGVITEFFNIFS